ncbi:hypothetical protein VTL71DRAFT_7516, partial [Oculimacula yallundae]
MTHRKSDNKLTSSFETHRLVNVNNAFKVITKTRGMALRIMPSLSLLSFSLLASSRHPLGEPNTGIYQLHKTHTLLDKHGQETYPSN